jgi:hypothetical protein
MKKILLILSLATSTVTFSQIQKVDIESTVLWKAPGGIQVLSKVTIDQDTVFKFKFRDMQYQYIVEYDVIYFKSLNEVNQFFTIVHDAGVNKTSEHLLLDDVPFTATRVLAMVTVSNPAGTFNIATKSVESLLEKIQNTNL